MRKILRTAKNLAVRGIFGIHFFSKLDKDVVLLPVNYIASQLYGNWELLSQAIQTIIL